MAERPPTTPRPDTIAAIATAPGRGGIGVVRVSGRGLLPLAQALTGKAPPPRAATLAGFRAGDGEVIDTGLLLYFPAPHSFTGEDVLELYGKGAHPASPPDVSVSGAASCAARSSSASTTCLEGTTASSASRRNSSCSCSLPRL